MTRVLYPLTEKQIALQAEIEYNAICKQTQKEERRKELFEIFVFGLIATTLFVAMAVLTTVPAPSFQGAV